MPLLIWDFDRTLGYREGRWADVLVEILDVQEPGHSFSADHFRPHLQQSFPWHNPMIVQPAHQPADQWWNQLHPVFQNAYRLGAGLSPTRAAELASQVRAFYIDPSKWRLYPDTRPALAELSTLGWKHALLSNHVPELQTILHTLDIDYYFEKVFNSAQTGIQKPHINAFRSVLHAFPNESAPIMIGDNLEADILGAEALGITGILVRQTSVTVPYACGSLDELPITLATIQRDKSSSCAC